MLSHYNTIAPRAPEAGQHPGLTQDSNLPGICPLIGTYDTRRL